MQSHEIPHPVGVQEKEQKPFKEKIINLTRATENKTKPIH